ncbi:YihY/virulence factor BrkB family protein [Halobaculum lipolyticum]|uniref:YihY/virulence factor BrkB family protein n=1 Tax=Halobaculum lipolyticum TaxID=3032001 RepID=A0ABD5WHR4_9EURY|nr:YihY/virulence factor BrkB family protein [Halobaculum sp. DT31]
MDRRRAVSLARAVVHEIRTEKLTFLAGSVAYHAFVSLLPLLVLVVLVLTTVGGEGLEAAFESLVAAALTPDAGRELLAELERASASTTLSVLGIGVLVWGALRVFRGLDTAFSDIYETEAENTFLDQLSDGLLVLVAFGAAVVAGAALEGALGGGPGGPAAWLLGRVALALAVSAALFPMYYVFPDTDVTVVEVLPGTVFAGTALAAAEASFRVYVSWSSARPDRSVVAAILVFLTWLYVSGLVILVGAALNAVLSNRSADVSIVPVFGRRPDPTERPDGDAVVGDLTRLRALLADTDGDADAGGAVTITVGDESVTLPAPERAAVDTASASGDGGVGVSLRWFPVDDGDDGDPDADPSGTGSD